MWIGMIPTPDSGFMRKLKTFDPNLDCEFNREVERFIITQPSRLRSGRLVAAVIDNPGQDHYRQPDNRDIRNLAHADFERKSHKRRILEGEERALQQEEVQNKKAEDRIMETTVDNKEWLRHKLSVAAGLKGDSVNAAFRRITHKPRGYKVEDRRRLSSQ